MDNQADQSAQPSQPQKDNLVQIGKYKIKILRDLCIGCGTCTAICPNVFELDDEYKIRVKQGTTDTPENILSAAQSCPVGAIIIIDTESGKQIWPTE